MTADDADRERLLERYSDLRVCDVRDGMDAMGYFFYGSMSEEIEPLYRTRIHGIAKTLRYLPWRGRLDYRDPRHYRDVITREYYRTIGTYPWVDSLRQGDICVIDQSGMDVGVMGSENSMDCWNRGVRGFITNGGIRDTDEVILERIPCWMARRAQTMVQARIAFDGQDVPVAVGGVQVRTGDVVVADGDGVVVVPQEIAVDVAGFAHEEHEKDKKARRRHYDKAGRAHDHTL